MNARIENEVTDPNSITRREAIRRTMLVLGVAITPALLDGVMHAQTASRASVAGPAYLSAPQFATVRAIAERILPKTDTPGANDVGVPAFIDLMYGKYLTDEEKIVFAGGLVEEARLARGGDRVAPALGVLAVARRHERRPADERDAAEQRRDALHGFTPRDAVAGVQFVVVGHD